MTTKKKSINVNTWVKGKLRQASIRWPPRNEALKKARVDRGQYKCAMCNQTFKLHQIHVDHIEPVIPLNAGEFDWNSFIERLFCPEEGLQILCTPCHDAKTAIEDQMRMFYKHGDNPPPKRKKK